jgi:membrane associated rhomboid family serine protease
MVFVIKKFKVIHSMLKTSNSLTRSLLSTQSKLQCLAQSRLAHQAKQSKMPRQLTKLEYKRVLTMSQQSLTQGIRGIARQAPRRNFNSTIDRLIQKVADRMPQGNLGVLIGAINAAIFGLYLCWPSYNMYSFMNNFTFSMYGVNKGCFWNLLTCHFTHMGFFSFLIDSAIMWLFCQNLSMMFGAVQVGRTILLSLLCGSTFLLAYHASARGQARAYYGNDALLRGLIFTMIFRNPQASFMLFPIPVNIPAWAIGGVLLFLDLLSMNVAGFGGTAAAFAMTSLL